MVKQFHTQAFNFNSAIQGGVDPRTGTFTANMPLGSVTGNHGLGPTLKLTLSYSPMSQLNTGLGIGVNLGISSYDRQKRSLVLSTGEQYKIIEDGRGKIHEIVHKKMENFKLEFKNEKYIVTYKSGQVEVLGGGSELKVLQQVFTPAGRRLDLKWDNRGVSPRILSISDESEPLLDVQYNEGREPTLNFFPNNSARSYSIKLNLDNSYLRQVTNKSLNPEETWYLDYHYINENLRPLKKIVGPTGYVQEVTHNDTGMKFPSSAGQGALPCVTTFVKQPANGQKPITTRFVYSEGANYLGRGLNGNWSENSDYGYGSSLSDYTYWSEEITKSPDTTQDVQIHRTYNNFHLLIKEEYLCKGLRQKTNTDYHAHYGRPMTRQPPQFQMPKEKKVTFTNPEKESAEEDDLTEFDEIGNPIKQRGKDGSLTTWTYYPAEGEPGKCPASPIGIVQFTKTETYTPPSSDYHSLPATKTHTYCSLRVAKPGEKYLMDMVLPEKEIEMINGIVMKETIKSYIDDPTSLDHGRLLKSTTVIHDNDAKTGYKNDVIYNWKRESDSILQETQFIGHDGLGLKHAIKQCKYTGKTLVSIDAQGNETHYEYDKKGAIVSQTENATSNTHKSVTTFKHFLEPGKKEGSKKITTTEIDPKGNQTRTHFDALGRQIRQEKLDSDVQRFRMSAEENWITTLQQQYDEFGNQSSVTLQEGLRENQESAKKLVTDANTVSYDGWGQNHLTTSADGTKEWTMYDPIKRCTIKQLEKGDRKLSKKVTYYNSSNFPVRVLNYDGSGELKGEVRNSFDGHGRLRKETDEVGNETMYEYDDFNRVIKTTLGDGTVIEKTYAPHTTMALVTSIKVDGELLGTQAFDSLKRLTTSTSGGRVYRFEYDESSPVPARVITPSGETIHYEYYKELGNAVKRVSGPGIEQSFEYDKITGAMTSASENGSLKRTMSYYPSGLLESETFITSDGKSKSTHYKYSLSGLLEAYTDVFGEVQYYKYDDKGRCKETENDNIKVTVVYDVFSRLSSRRVTNKKTGKGLTTTVIFDDLSREIKRQISPDNQDSLIIEQNYHKNHLLKERTTTRGEQLLYQETFEYDNRCRIVDYTCTGDKKPVDPYGKPIDRQTFGYDKLGNITKCTTYFNGGENTATFTYDKVDPTQLHSLHNTHPSHPKEIILQYDEQGRMIRDEASRVLDYDVLGRLKRVTGPTTGGTYGYDALNMLVEQDVKNGSTIDLYYKSDSLIAEANRDGSSKTRYMKMGSNYLGQDKDGVTQLFACNKQNSVIASYEDNKVEDYVYSPYGYSARDKSDKSQTLIGFMGERWDPVSESYHLGNGTRSYNPVLMRFTSPDTWSPFGSGGINPYAFCEGDPINRMDPTGHLSLGAWLGIGIGILTVIAVVVTAGAAIAVAGSVAAAWSAVSFSTFAGGAALLTVGATKIAGNALEEAAPDVGKVILAAGDLIEDIMGAFSSIKNLGKSLKGAFGKKGAGSLDRSISGGGSSNDRAPIKKIIKDVKKGTDSVIDLAEKIGKKIIKTVDEVEKEKKKEDSPSTYAIGDVGIKYMEPSDAPYGSSGVASSYKMRAGSGAELNVNSPLMITGAPEKSTSIMGEALGEMTRSPLPGTFVNKLQDVGLESSIQKTLMYHMQISVSSLNQQRYFDRVNLTNSIQA